MQGVGSKMKGKRGREEILNLQIIVSVELEDAVCFHHWWNVKAYIKEMQ